MSRVRLCVLGVCRVGCFCVLCGGVTCLCVVCVGVWCVFI